MGQAGPGRRWLLGLLILQSISSVVLDSYQDLLREHIVVTFFLTMLVRSCDTFQCPLHSSLSPHRHHLTYFQLARL